MAFKFGHGMGLALALAAAAAGCESKPKGADVPVTVGTDKGPKSPPAASAWVAPSEKASQPTVPAKAASESPADRVTRLGGKIEREDAIVTRIDFFGAPIISDADLEVLRFFPDLQSLGLSSTKVTDEGLEHLVGLNKLRTLSLAWTDITDRGLVTLAKLPALQNVDLLRTKVTDKSVAELQKALPRLTINR
jgi:Leucine-rich repeat (LRR) protein